MRGRTLVGRDSERAVLVDLVGRVTEAEYMVSGMRGLPGLSQNGLVSTSDGLEPGGRRHSQ